MNKRATTISLVLGLVTSLLGGGVYSYAVAVDSLESQVTALENELLVAKAKAIDEDELAEVLKNLARPAKSQDKRIYGSATARYTLVEMTDTECPHCRVHFNVLKKFIESTAGWVNAGILHVPALGEASRQQAVAVECAGEQGGSDAAWKYIEELFEKTGGGGQGVPQSLESLATDLNLDGRLFSLCTDSTHIADRVMKDLEQATELGIKQTPSVLVRDNKTGLSIILQGEHASEEGILNALASLSKQGEPSERAH